MNLEARKPGFYRRKRISEKRNAGRKNLDSATVPQGNKSGNTTAGRDESGSQEPRTLSEETNQEKGAED
jgi:hypothetical protein